MIYQQTVAVDVVIFGGGVAGLWLLARLRQANYNAILVESGTLGSGQTRYAQGIIHGGTKYALTGKLTASSEAVSQMPGVWRECLQGHGEIDLREVKTLSPHQYMWSTTSLTSRMAGFFASHVMRSRTKSLAAQERPEIFRDPGFKGHVYRLDEPVLDTASIIAALAKPHLDAIVHATLETVTVIPDDSSHLVLKANDGTVWQVDTKRIVLAAGQGNAGLLHAMGRESPAMQLRPLHMVMLRGGLPERLYAHCLGASVNPRLTITSHSDTKGEIVWYLGGQLSEDGVNRSDAEQVQAAQHELQDLMPWLDLSQAQWSTLRIDRAEPRQADGKRPDTSFVEECRGVITTWPTKMALSPKLATDVIEQLQQNDIVATGTQTLPAWPQPVFAVLPWQEETRWN
ncbi:MAG: FAD-dependent oxidoreductase [Gammaproteobacteria bacterium]|nr:FAD-dependent oxidoreductase [Gammaproteobacteria bacterium]